MFLWNWLEAYKKQLPRIQSCLATPKAEIKNLDKGQCEEPQNYSNNSTTSNTFRLYSLFPSFTLPKAATCLDQIAFLLLMTFKSKAPQSC